MGKRKTKMKKPKPKPKPPLDKTFNCLFCNHEKSIVCHMDKTNQIGTLICKICGQMHQSIIHNLSAPVDIYSDWIDACDAVANQTKKSPKTPNKNNKNILHFSENQSHKNDTWNFLDDFDSSPLRTPSRQRIIDSLERDKLKSPSYIETPKSKITSIKLSNPLSINEDSKSSKIHQNIYMYNDLVNASDIQNTYAKRRSFITESTDDMENLFFSSYNINSKKQLFNKLNPKNSEAHDLNIKNIHELRDSGINKRSLDEIQYLVDGLNKSNTLRHRQSCYIELAKKMNEAEFSRNFKSGNFYHQLLENSEKDTDIVLTYSQKNKKLISFRLFYIALLKLVKSSNLHIDYNIESSCYFFSINAIKSIISLSTLKTSNHLEKMASFNCVSVFYDIIDKIHKKNINEQICIIEIIINSIEKYSFVMDSDTHIKKISIITTLLTSDLFNNSEKKYKSRIFQSSLRLLINLTNNNPSICDEVAHSKFIQILIDTIISTKNDSLDSDQSSDNTLLSLGLLINIVEKGSKINYILEHYDTKNTLIGIVTIDKLINTFNEWKKYSYNVENNIATGYLAILLAHLSLKNNNSESNFLSRYIREKLPDNSYNIIIKFLQEFAQFNMEIEKEAAGTFGIKSSGIANEIQKISEILYNLESKLIV
ncbi:hypothetical protein PMAC_000083 [Pneumocystis sp. 'macacae']|nr:hypothetical protein PMAC_000083 [Pneumocystis sp. 'macacae']